MPSVNPNKNTVELMKPLERMVGQVILENENIFC
jgi:hypothetical protein